MWKEGQNLECEGRPSKEGEACPRECDCGRNRDVIQRKVCSPSGSDQPLNDMGRWESQDVGSGLSSASKQLCNPEYFAYPF